MYRKIGRTVAAAFIATIASAAFASTAIAGLADRVRRQLRRRAHHPAVPALRRLGQLQAAPRRLFEAGDAALEAQRRGEGRLGQRDLQGRRRDDRRSLSLPEGSRAVSPFTCVGLNEPTLRLFAKRNSALLGLVSTLSVQIQVKTSLGLSLWLPVLPGDLGGSSWHPTVRCR